MPDGFDSEEIEFDDDKQGDDFEEVEFEEDEMPDQNFDDSDFVITDEFDMEDFPDFDDFESFGEEEEY